MSVDSSESASASDGVYDDLEYLNLIFQVCCKILTFQVIRQLELSCNIFLLQDRRGSDTEQSNLDHQSSSSMESNLEVVSIPLKLIIGISKFKTISSVTWR